ncbi:hypothetical protein V2J09_024082 [Rumex salicifolius]
MILRTPVPRKRRAESPPPGSSSDRHLVIYEDPAPPALDSSNHPSEQMLCTYQCRQMVKSEFLDTLSSTEKLVSDYQNKLETTNDNLHKAESEGRKYHDELLYAEQELAASRGREQALQEQLLKEINDSKERLKKQLHICSEAEGKLQKEINLRKTAELSAASAEEKANLFEQKLSHLSDSIEREKKHLKDELLQFEQESKLSVSRIRTDLERMECRANNAEKESAMYKEQLEAVKKQFRECLTQKSELENKLTMSSSPLKDSTETNSDMLVKQLQEELRNYESEVHEARKLRASYENIELLKEKLMEEKINRESAQIELLKLPEMQLALEKLEDELLSWKKISQDIPGVSNPEDVVVKFSALQKEVLDSMAKLGETNSRLKQMEVALEEAEHVKRSFETDAAFTMESVGSLKSEVKHLEAMLSSVTGERDELRNAINRLKQENFEKGDVASTGTLLQELESSLQKKDSYIKELENNLHEHKDACGRQCNEMRILSERLNSEAKRIKSSERENDRLRSEIALLESKLGHGDYSASSTKVLRMVNTLGVESEARRTIEALQSELQKANEKLKIVEELKNQSADAGLLVDSYISGQIVHLKEQIATLEKREERYKTVFADRISVFRRACCELFGYKIVMDDQQRPNGIPVTRFILQSIYAQSDDEKLEFEYESGNTNILPNAYTKQSDIFQQVEIFIRKMNSIPAFTANLTVESFNRRTLS